MDYITRLGKKYSLSKKVVNFLSDLVRNHNGQAVKILDAIIAGEDVSSNVDALMRNNNIKGDDLKILEEIEEKLEDITKLLSMTIKDLDKSQSKAFKLPLLETGKKGKSASLELGADAELKFEVSTDDDGRLGDKVNDFFNTFSTQEICLCLGVRGKINGTVSVSGKGVYDFGASVKTWGNANLFNYYIYQDSAPLLPALVQAIPSFKLPGELSSSKTRLDDNQYIHLHLDDGIELQGKLKCEQAIIEAITFTGGFDTTISVLPTPSVEFDFSYKTGGSADVLFYQKRGVDDLFARVILQESRTSSSGLGFGVCLGISGLDGIFKAILQNYFGGIDTLVKEIEKKIKAFPNLNALFKNFISGRVDSYLGGIPVQELNIWLQQNLGTPNIVNMIKKAFVEAGVEVAANVLNNMQSNITVVQKHLLELIQKYQNVRKRFDTAVKKSAEAKISLSIKHKLETMNSRGQKYEFQIKRNGTSEIIKQMSLGVFTPAIEAAESGKNVKIICGEREIEGFRKITNTLNISLLGLQQSQKTLFTQKWNYKVTANGDISMFVSGKFQSDYQDWFKRRKAALLLDTRLLAHTNEKLLRVLKLKNSFSYEVAWLEENPDKEKLEKILEQITTLGVNLDIPVVLNSLRKDNGKNKPYGNLDLALLMELSRDNIRSLLGRNETPMEIFAKNRVLYTAHDSFKRVTNDKIGTEFLLLTSVQKYAMKVRTNATKDGFGTEAGGKNITFRREEGEYINQYCLHVEEFDKFITAVDSYSKAVPDLTSVNNALVSIKKAQVKLLQAGELFVKDPYLNLVFFRTLCDLIGWENVMPSLVITRKSDGKKLYF